MAARESHLARGLRPCIWPQVPSLKRDVPDLTLDRTVWLLEAALAEPELKLARAIALVDYHVRRNEVARRSHAKTWRAKHRGLKFLRL